MFEKKLMIFSLSSYRKHSSLIFLFVLFVAMGSIIWFGILPLKRSLDMKMRGIQEYYADQENQQKQVGRLPELKDQYDVIMKDGQTLDIIITEDRIVDFIKTLEGLANDSSVQMTITSNANGQIIEKVPIKVVPPKADGANTQANTSNTKPKVMSMVDDAPFDRYLRLSIKAEGSYGDIVAFLQKIETLPIGLDVIGVEMKKRDASATKDTIGTKSNPFALLGDGSVPPPGETAQTVAQTPLEATFDMLVYVNKKK